jgi:hypothetical protein
MSRRYTTIRLRGVPDSGLTVSGRQAPVHMIADLRAHAKAQLEWANKVMSAKDEDFHVTTHLGHLVRHDVVVLQEGEF